MLFNDPRQQNHERFELYYAFAEVLHLMVKCRFSEQDVVDPRILINLFLEHHTDFVDREGEFC
jgi:hypothetical protein